MSEVHPAMTPNPPFPAAGMAALADAQRPQLDRLPALPPTVDQLAAGLARRFSQLAGEDAEVRVEAIRQRDLPDCLAAIGAEAALARFECLPQAGAGLIGIENRLVRPLLDLALGGGSAAAAQAVAARPATTIELRLIERLMRQMLAELACAVRALAPLEFRLDRVDARPRPPSSTGPSAPVLVVSLRAVVRGVAGGIEIILPSAAIDRLRGTPAHGQGTGAQAPGGWTARLLATVREAEIELEAVLHEGMVGLGFARDLRPGQTLPFAGRPDAAIAVRCGDVAVAMAGVACREGRLVLAVERTPIDGGASP